MKTKAYRSMAAFLFSIVSIFIGATISVHFFPEGGPIWLVVSWSVWTVFTAFVIAGEKL